MELKIDIVERACDKARASGEEEDGFNLINTSCNQQRIIHRSNLISPGTNVLAGERQRLKDYCKHFPIKRAVEYLKGSKEWDLLDYFNPDRIDQAEVFASIHQFLKAVRTLDAISKTPEEHQKTLENTAMLSEAFQTSTGFVQRDELLHSYLLKVSPIAQIKNCKGLSTLV